MMMMVIIIIIIIHDDDDEEKKRMKSTERREFVFRAWPTSCFRSPRHEPSLMNLPRSPRQTQDVSDGCYEDPTRDPEADLAQRRREMTDSLVSFYFLFLSFPFHLLFFFFSRGSRSTTRRHHPSQLVSLRTGARNENPWFCEINY